MVTNNGIYSAFKRIAVSEDWFEIYKINPELFVFCETGHYENTVINLAIGRDKAALIDTGCGIGNLCKVVEEVTNEPILVINTHTHKGSSRQQSSIF